MLENQYFKYSEDGFCFSFYFYNENAWTNMLVGLIEGLFHSIS